MRSDVKSLIQMAGVQCCAMAAKSRMTWTNPDSHSISTKYSFLQEGVQQPNHDAGPSSPIYLVLPNIRAKIYDSPFVAIAPPLFFFCLDKYWDSPFLLGTTTSFHVFCNSFITTLPSNSTQLLWGKNITKKYKNLPDTNTIFTDKLVCTYDFR